MPTQKNQTDLAQNDLTAYVFDLDKMKNASVAIHSDPGNQAASAVRLDLSWDGVNFVTTIALQDPTAAIGAAYVTSVATGKTGLTQDRAFGAVKGRIVRTDANAGACKITTSVTFN